MIRFFFGFFFVRQLRHRRIYHRQSSCPDGLCIRHENFLRICMNSLQIFRQTSNKYAIETVSSCGWSQRGILNWFSVALGHAQNIWNMISSEKEKLYEFFPHYIAHLALLKIEIQKKQREEIVNINFVSRENFRENSWVGKKKKMDWMWWRS